MDFPVRQSRRIVHQTEMDNYRRQNRENLTAGHDENNKQSPGIKEITAKRVHCKTPDHSNAADQQETEKEKKKKWKQEKKVWRKRKVEKRKKERIKQRQQRKQKRERGKRSRKRQRKVVIKY